MNNKILAWYSEHYNEIKKQFPQQINAIESMDRSQLVAALVYHQFGLFIGVDSAK